MLHIEWAFDSYAFVWLFIEVEARKPPSVKPMGISFVFPFAYVLDATSPFYNIPLESDAEMEGLLELDEEEEVTAVEDEDGVRIIIFTVPGADSPVRTTRTVWRLSQPLEATWNIFNPSRTNIKYQHWAVVVANMNKDEFEKLVKQPKKRRRMSETHLGEIHQLHRDGAKANYCFDKFLMMEIRKGVQFTFVGQTTLTDEEIMDIGIA